MLKRSVLRVVSKDELEGALARACRLHRPLAGKPIACVDVRELVAAAHEQGVAAVCDLSVVGAACAAVRLGADVAFASATDEGENAGMGSERWAARCGCGTRLLSAGREAGDTGWRCSSSARTWRASSDAAQVVASYLVCHPRVERVAYPVAALGPLVRDCFSHA